ncbi:uncharacterized protein ACWYII_001118 [Salvelinus alpinus]
MDQHPCGTHLTPCRVHAPKNKAVLKRKRMCYGLVNIDGNGIFHGSVGELGKLEWVQCEWHAGLDVGHYQPLETLHDGWGLPIVQMDVEVYSLAYEFSEGSPRKQYILRVGLVKEKIFVQFEIFQGVLHHPQHPYFPWLCLFTY